MADDPAFEKQIQLDVESGFLRRNILGTGHYSPKIVLNDNGRTVEHSIVEELKRCSSFTFSVAFISPGAIAQLKQHFVDFEGRGLLITSDYLGFNSPEAFYELLNLKEKFGIDVRRHTAPGFHPKGYLFRRAGSITAMVGSSNLTSSALSSNHEWNLKVSAANGSDLELQLSDLVADQISSSEPISTEWVESYSHRYSPVPGLTQTGIKPPNLLFDSSLIRPNSMQEDALLALDLSRAGGAERAIIISATGTGKTMLSALDAKAFSPERLLFVVHREQILDRTIAEFKKVFGGTSATFGKLTGSSKETNTSLLFATIQTLSKDLVMQQFEPDHFDYIIFDEAHRAAGETYQRVLKYFTPKFLLGMTATPERTDASNVFEIFDHNVPYEIRLQHALEAGMLCPFHYYGVSDVEFEDGTTTSDATQLGQLVSADRIKHLVSALDTYGQAGVAPRGLIFCSRKDEARELSALLNEQRLRGRSLRTVALTGDDSVDIREQKVLELENGQLDYIITVDVFNEGVDIPSVNQVIMLRQTQSAIVFVQQLGRGLRLADGKEYLVVIDFIGNYTNNFLIPIALFGDESLNRETLRERLNETVEAGALPGLSSVSFDQISRERILRSISQTKLDSFSSLKSAVLSMQNRVGRPPTLGDFYRFFSVDPVLLATKKAHYPALLDGFLGRESLLSQHQSQCLSLLSHEVFAGKRLHELVLLDFLLSREMATLPDIEKLFREHGLLWDRKTMVSAIDTLCMNGFPQNAQARYREGVAYLESGALRLTKSFREWLVSSEHFAAEVADLLETGKKLTADRYLPNRIFTPGMQYTRSDAAHLLGWPRSVASTIYGVKTDTSLGICAIFVTLEKSEDVAATTAYQDQILDPSTMRWFTKSKRNLTSRDVAPIVSNSVDIHVFVKKSDADRGEHYYLGQATADQAIETTMPVSAGETVPVVSMLLRFDKPVSQGLFDYFAPM